MPSTKLIRNRIKAIKSTSKITKAMEMVAASKMKKAQDSTVQNRPYSESIYEMVLGLSAEPNISHPLLSKKKKKSDHFLLVVIASDKGLCGSFNTSVFKKASEFLEAHPKTDLVTIGKKTENFFRRRGKEIIATFTDFPVYPHILDIRPIVGLVSKSYQKEDYDEILVCFTEFVTSLKQITQIQSLLPLEAEHLKKEQEILNQTIVIKFEPNSKEVLSYLIPRILEIRIYQMILESIASEQSARMVAMKNATDAANDLIDDLNLTYNSIRQANITQELAEISAGANLKQSENY